MKHTEFTPSTAAPDDLSGAVYLPFVGDALVLARDGEGVRLLTDLGALPVERTHPIGRLRGAAAFSVVLPKHATLPEDLRAEGLRGAVGLLDPATWSAAAYASQIAHWDRTNRFCGACAAGMALVAGERAMRCEACDHSVYPRISPCTITLVHDGRRILMTRQASWPAGRYGLVAGFVEPGESLEDCARREILEETEVVVDDVQYAGSQPWPFPGQMMVGFTARWVRGEVRPRAGELEDARWFDVDALPVLPPRFSIARRLIDDHVRALAR